MGPLNNFTANSLKKMWLFGVDGLLLCPDSSHHQQMAVLDYAASTLGLHLVHQVHFHSTAGRQTSVPPDHLLKIPHPLLTFRGLQTDFNRSLMG